MNNTSNKIYEILRESNEFYVKTHRIVNKNKSHIYTNSLLSAPKTFEIGKLNKFTNTDCNIPYLYCGSSDNYGFTTNKDLAECHCRKYNLLLEMQKIDNKLEELFEEENYLAKQKQKLVEKYNKTLQVISHQVDMMDIRKHVKTF